MTYRLEIASASAITITTLPLSEWRGVWTVFFPGNIISKGAEPVAYNLPVGMQIDVRVDYVDAGGNPATVDGVVGWASSDATIASVTSTGAQTAAIAAVGKLGQAQITATADADLGSGTKSLLTTADITVVAGEAVAGTITPVGEPVPIP